MGNAKCSRSGVCCKKLYVHIMPEIAKRCLKRKNRKNNPNTKPRISKAWIEDAEKAEKLGLQYFPCRFLEGDNVCTLQDKKPEVCTNTFKYGGGEYPYGGAGFFHHKCGFLNGAPNIVIRVARLLEEMTKIKTSTTTKNWRRWLSLNHRYEILLEHEDNRNWKIENGDWVKDEMKGIEK